MQTDSKKHDTPTDANNVLAAGFRSVREIADMTDEDFEANCKRFEKLIKK